jgi:hypothetical protein
MRRPLLAKMFFVRLSDTLLTHTSLKLSIGIGMGPPIGI